MSRARRENHQLRGMVERFRKSIRREIQSARNNGTLLRRMAQAFAALKRAKEAE